MGRALRPSGARRHRGGRAALGLRRVGRASSPRPDRRWTWRAATEGHRRGWPAGDCTCSPSTSRRWRSTGPVTSSTTGGLSDRCRVEVADLDDGLPAGASVDLVLCHLFNAPHLDRGLVERLRPGGLVGGGRVERGRCSAGTLPGRARRAGRTIRSLRRSHRPRLGRSRRRRPPPGPARSSATQVD